MGQAQFINTDLHIIVKSILFYLKTDNYYIPLKKYSVIIFQGNKIDNLKNIV